MMPSSTPRRDAIAVALTAAGGLLVGIGDVALWLLLPLAGATLTLALGGTLVVLGVRALLRSAR